MTKRSIAWRLKNNRIMSWLRFNPRFGPLWSRLQWYDDFNWNTYTRDSYKQQLTQAVEPKYTTQLAQTSFRVVDGHIILDPHTQPIHPKHAVIYETVLALQPASVFEFGFGAGDQLANFRLLLPDVKLGGVDISDSQRAYALERNAKELTTPATNPVWLNIRDMTQPDAARDVEGWAEFVYCQAVLMHIHGQGRHRQFLKNMWRVSQRFVLIVENWMRHDYVADLQALFPNAKLYRVEHEGVVGILLDKQNAVAYPQIVSDKQLRATSVELSGT